jgi:uncharacterized protein (TIGR03000 family)
LDYWGADLADGSAGAAPARASVIVEVPEGADLYVDGQKSALAAAKRELVTPALEPGEEYFMTLTTVRLCDGKKVERTRQVTFRAGDTVQVSLREAVAVASRVTVRLPGDARLSINGVASKLTSDKRSFTVPNLEAGRKYAYTFQAEVVRDGKPRSESRRVVFEGGKPVEVDFRSLDALATARR